MPLLVRVPAILVSAVLLSTILPAGSLMAQDFEHICPNTLTVSTNYGTAGCSLSVDFQVLGYKDNEPFTYSVAFATQCTPQVGGTAGNNFVVDGNGFNHAPNDTACTGRYANPPPSTDDPAGICVDISQLDPGWGPITIPNLPPGVYYLQVITSSTTTYNFCSGMAVYNDYACVPVTIQPSGGCATVLPTPTPCAALTRHWYMTPSNGLVGTYTNADCGADNTLNLSSTGPVTLTSPLLTGCYMGGTWAFDFWTFTTGTQVTVNFGTSNPGGGGFNPMGSATGTMGTSVVTGGQYDSPVNLSLGSFCLNNQSLVLIVSGNSTVDWNDCADFPSAVFGPLGYGCITPTPTATSTATAPATPTSTPSSTLTSTASATPSPSFTVTPTLTATSTGTGTPTATSSSTSTSTATSTATATNTPTSTPTSTFSSTSTPTPTHSPTLTASNTSTPTPTSTPTLTAIPTDTATKTPTATATVTPSPTPTNTATDTDTPVFTNTPTSTPTNSATATNTSTFTPSFTPTATSTRTPTDTPSSTSTETSTSTSTNTPTDTATLTATDTPVFTLTPTSTPTNSATPTFTNTSTPSPTPTSTSTPTPTDTPSSTSTETSTSTSTHTPTYTATDSMTPTATPSSTPSNTETSTATNTATDTPVFTLTPTSTPTNSATATFTHTFTPSPTPTRTATPTPTDTPSRTPTPTSTFTPSNTTTFTPTPTVTNTFTFSATPSSTFTSSNTATFTPTLTPTSDVEIAKTASEAMAKSGDVITYTITLNVPQGPANGVTVADTLPQYLGFVAYGPVPSGGMALAANGQSLMWVFPVLTGPVTLAYQAKVADYVPGGTLLVNNAQVDCIGNPVPKKASVSVAMAQAYTVKIGVYNEAGELVKQVSVQELSQEITDFSILQSSTITSLHGVVYVEVNGQVIATWDGTNNNGDPVSNGAYYLKVDNIDPSGVDTSVTRQVTVNRSIEKISVDIYNEAGEVVRHLYAWSDDPGSMNLGNVTLSSNVIEPMVGTPTPGGASDLTLTFPNGVTLTWDGRDDKGQIVTNGAYQVEVHWTDGKGGDQVITQQVLVEGRNGAAGAGTVWAAPNVLKRGIAQTMIGVSSNLSLTLSVELYDVAGERVKPAVTGSLGVDQVLVDISGLASGLYLAVVTLRDAQGGFEGRQVVKVLVSH